MSTDAELISWLRRTPLYDSNRDDVDDLADEAADRLAALIAERDELHRLQRPFVDQLKHSTETIQIVAAERDALKEALRKAADMLHTVAGDIEDGYSLDSLRGKYVLAILNARDNARAAFIPLSPGEK